MSSNGNALTVSAGAVPVRVFPGINLATLSINDYTLLTAIADQAECLRRTMLWLHLPADTVAAADDLFQMLDEYAGRRDDLAVFDADARVKLAADWRSTTYASGPGWLPGPPDTTLKDEANTP